MLTLLHTTTTTTKWSMNEPIRDMWSGLLAYTDWRKLESGRKHVAGKKKWMAEVGHGSRWLKHERGPERLWWHRAQSFSGRQKRRGGREGECQTSHAFLPGDPMVSEGNPLISGVWNLVWFCRGLATFSLSWWHLIRDPVVYSWPCAFRLMSWPKLYFIFQAYWRAVMSIFPHYIWLAYIIQQWDCIDGSCVTFLFTNTCTTIAYCPKKWKLALKHKPNGYFSVRLECL